MHDRTQARAGRPGSPADPFPTRSTQLNHIVGIDLGGTNIVVGCVAEDGSRLLGLLSEPTRPELGADGVLARMIEVSKRSIAAAKAAEPEIKIAGVGIGAPGPLDAERNIIRLAPNLGWKDFPLRQRIGEGLGLSAVLDNDANCAALGEWWQGAARGTKNAVCLTIGTGIGGGIIIKERLYHGASSAAGELGHTTIDAGGRRCKCGNYGCIEAYASGPAIAARAVEALEAGAESRLPAMVDDDLSAITAQTVYDAAHAGDELALEVVRDTAVYLGAAIANFVNIFNPEVIVVCGGVTLAREKLFHPLQREVAKRAFKPAVEVCRIVPGELPGTAGVLGAARAFLDHGRR
ncbi:MAG: ROK family protein [Gemmatimonadales bacterium]